MVTPPIVTEHEQEQDSRNRGSDLQDSSATSTQDNNAPVVTFGATGTTPSGAEDVTGLGATDTPELPGDGTEVATITDPNTVTLAVDLPLAADSGDPVPSLTAIDLNDGLLSEGGLSTDGPLAPPLPGVMLGSLDLVRRDLEQMFAPLTDDTQQDTGDTLIIDESSNDSGPVLLTAALAPEPPSSKVSDPLTIDPTLDDRNSLFRTEQAKRLAAFNEAQAARVEAFNEQQAAMSANPIGAILNSAAFVVSELVNIAAVVVTEFVNYISLAVTNFIQGISDWFTAPAVFTGMYGDPVASSQYWQKQNAENCVLQSAAMLVGQLKGLGAMPDEVGIANLAVTEDSVVDEGEKMYKGLYVFDENGQQVFEEDGSPKYSEDRVDVKDAMALLDKYYGISSTLTKYDKTQGNIALRAVAFALQDNQAVSVGVHAGSIWSEVEGGTPPTVSAADHQVVVTGIDFDARTVHLNDSALNNGNVTVSLDTFMRAWQADSYETWIATLKEPATPTSGVTSTNVSGSTVLVSVS